MRGGKGREMRKIRARESWKYNYGYIYIYVRIIIIKFRNVSVETN